MDDAVAGATTLRAAADVVCDHIVAAGMPLPSVYVEVAGKLRCLAQRGYWQVHDGVPPEVGVLGATFRSGTPSIIQDVRTSPDFIAAGAGVQSEATVPFRHGGQVVGCVNVESQRPLSRQDIDVVHAAALALQGWMAVHGGLPRESPWQRLAHESAALAALRTHSAIHQLAAQRATALTGMTSSVLVKLGGAQPEVAAAHGPLGPTLAGLEPDTLRAIAGWTSSGASVYTFGAFPHTGFGGSAQIWDAGISSLIVVAVMGEEGARGFLMVADGRPGQPDTVDVQVLELYAAHLAIALQSADMMAALRRQAQQDTLTGLPHGAVLHADLRTRVGRGEALAVLVIDLDHFKAVNDGRGHQHGDEVLMGLARSLQRVLRGEGTAYRIGGDEFAAVAAVPDAGAAEDLAERIRTTAPTSHGLTVSVGVRYHDGSTGALDPDRLMADADIALYAAKSAGRDRVALYTPPMRHAVLERAQLAAELASAVDGELHLLYQPIVSLRSGGITGAEALIRWSHPTRGLLLPPQFVAIAEEDGQIEAVGAWVLRTALAAVATWREATGLPTSVSVNVSGRQLTPAFADEVVVALREAGVPATALVAEITESALVDDPGRVEVLAALRAMGVRIAVDDFGTGWSSLSYLRRLPLDVVKIDRSFVADLDDDRTAAVARAVIELADSVGLDSVAEGVETAAQAEHLRQLGCRWAQGYLFHRPTTSEAFIDLVEQWRRDLG